jgi:hypothetical protein
MHKSYLKLCASILVRHSTIFVDKLQLNNPGVCLADVELVFKFHWLPSNFNNPNPEQAHEVKRERCQNPNIVV